jgi:sulfate permease, SulP family
MPSSRIPAAQAEPSFAELFTPKLITVLREGYGWSDLRSDAVSGLTVAVVALPLSMAIAIASGVSPERGLYTAIAGGLIISLIWRQPLSDRRTGRRIYRACRRRS